MLTMVVSVTAIIVGVRVELKSVKSTVSALAGKLEKHDQTIFSIAGQLQRVIGMVDAEQHAGRRSYDPPI
jgi:hypothetical protein